MKLPLRRTTLREHYQARWLTVRRSFERTAMAVLVSVAEPSWSTAYSSHCGALKAMPIFPGSLAWWQWRFGRKELFPSCRFDLLTSAPTQSRESISGSGTG